MMFILIPLLFMLAVALYIILRLIRPLPLPFIVKIAASLLVLGLSQKLLFVRLVWPMLSPADMPISMLLGLSMLHAMLILLFIITFVCDLGFMIVRFLGLRANMRHTSFSVSFLGMSALCLTVFGMWQALGVPKVREVTLFVPYLEELAPDFEGLRIAHLTDIHIGPIFNGAWLSSVVTATNEVMPDLVVLTGDIVDGKPSSILKDAQHLRRLQAPYGVILSVGNHEYISGLDEWVLIFRDMGIRVLLNEHTILTQGKSALVVAGVTDPAAGYRGGEFPNPAKALQGAPPDALRLMLAHQPVLFKESVAAGADIQLSGHTHGGTLFFLKPLIRRFNAGFVHGLYMVEDALLYVNAGVGLWDGFPIRLGVPPEIIVFTLRSEGDDEKHGVL